MGPMSFVSGSHLTCNAEHLEISNASDGFINNMIEEDVKTGSPQVLLGGPGGQGTRVEVSPDTSRA